MTNIVEQLRREAEIQRSAMENQGDERIAAMMNDAAEEIEQLRNDLNVQYCGLKTMLAEKDFKIEALRKENEKSHTKLAGRHEGFVQRD